MDLRYNVTLRNTMKYSNGYHYVVNTYIYNVLMLRTTN